MKYLLKAPWQKDFVEVLKDQYLTAEKNAGFHSKVAGTPATSSFNSNGTEGKIDYEYLVPSLGGASDYE